MSVKKCIYCGQDKPQADFSHEHIWPDALGGDFLESFWHTEDVCGRCNSLSGVFVDGAFIKGLFGGAERASGARDYIDVAKPASVLIPLDYCGQLNRPPLPPDEIGEYWAGPCGANILHIRPADRDDQWATYAGGDPRAKKIKAGRAYMALVSNNRFWVDVSLNSFKAHFKRAQRFITNQLDPATAEYFKTNFNTHVPDPTDPTQARDMDVMNQVISAGRNGTWLKLALPIQLDTGTRMLAKLALAVGYKLFGAEFLDSDSGKTLRQGLREADANKRKKLPINGTGYLGPQPFSHLKDLLGWPGWWVLIIKLVAGKLMLSVVTPIGRTMAVVITESPTLLERLDQTFIEGNLWLTIPSLSRSEGPIWLPDYLAHRAGTPYLPALTAIEAMRVDPATLPPCD
jgi:hypothetical protein